ncbi:MAG: hypothetical protein HN921_12985 [Bacteroidetes bacterium]|nr:hypothetical protein [Bacteroidota bacterium]MBT7040745.1 hypothetical protein [Bacteroidota bacterium]MBT7827208.1 hypothetical protein [Bacteroidota bacterium]
MNYPANHEQDFFVSWHETDFQAKMTIKSISDMLMELAWLHAGELGFGFEDLETQSYLWVLSRLKIDIINYPKWRENIKAKTWPVDIQKLFANRHFNVKNEKEEIIINAGSNWLIIDNASRRPVRPEKVFHERVVWTNEKAVSEIDKIDVSACDEMLYSKKVKYSDLDFNKHVINSKYIEMTMDALSESMLMAQTVSSFQINFIAEGRMGDELQLYSNKTNDTFKILRLADQKEVVHVRIDWK